VKADDAMTQPPERAAASDTRARLMLVLLCLIWGITWPLMRIGLTGIPPFAMRTISGASGALTLYLICVVQRRPMRVANATTWVHIFVASMLNVVGFSVFSVFAQLATATSRVAIVAYSLPIWSVLFAWPFLGERPNRTQVIALGLTAVGLGVLIYPLTAAGFPLGVLLAAGTAVSWAAGTVYMKWARIGGDPMAVASWQVTIAFVVITACMLVFEGELRFDAMPAKPLITTIFVGIVGGGIAYGLWFEIVRRLPATTASLGVLCVPVVGVIASMAILGEVPTQTDMVGFALIFAASACVLLTRQKPAEPVEPMP